MTTRRVSHPILRLHVLEPDGTRQTENRVFCRKKVHSVGVEDCCKCVHCDAITGGPLPQVQCSLPEAPPLAPADCAGEQTAVGTLLMGGVVAIAESATIGAAVGLMRAEALRSIPVVGDDRLLIGVVREPAFLGHSAEGSVLGVRTAMSAPIAVHEQTPIRSALRVLASHHLREITVVSLSGAPIGVFRDVDGLHWIGVAQRGEPTR